MDGGGLYGNGSNTPPLAHCEAGLLAASQVPDSGAVVIALGQSITNAIWLRWKQLEVHNSDAVLINGACPGCTFANGAWVDLNAEGWIWAFDKLALAGVTPDDVDVVWMSVTHSQIRGATADQYDALLPVIRQAFPNLQMLFVANRTYSGYRTESSGEPSVWGEGLAIREFVNRHLAETDPWIGWAGDLWSEGDVTRSDGLLVVREDFSDDGLHYTTTGRQKFAEWAIAQFRSSPFTSWYADSRDQGPGAEYVVP